MEAAVAALDKKQAEDKAKADGEGSDDGDSVSAEPDVGVKVDFEKLNKEADASDDDNGWQDPTDYDYEAYKEGRAALLNPLESEQSERAERRWASSAVRYEWSDEFGDVGPADPEVEKALFDKLFMLGTGMNFDQYSYECEIKGPYNPGHISTWEDSGIHPQVLENVALCKFNKPTPVQSFVIPAALAGLDVVAISQTGTGKTGAYLLPIISRLMGKAKQLCARRAPSPEIRVKAEPLVLVICPTRELAIQVFRDACRFAYRSMLRPCVVYGGQGNMMDQIRNLQMGCDILIGTPGRLRDFCSRPTLITLRRVKYTVVDEADELLEEDWNESIDDLMRGGDVNEDADHAYLMFSATFPRPVRHLAGKYMSKDFVRVKCGRIGSATNNVCQRIIWVDREKKEQCLLDLLNTLPATRTVIFVRSKRSADMLDDFLYRNQLPCTSIHGNKTQAEREDAMFNFRKARCPILVATGISARGIDVVNVMHVINYDLPAADQGGIKEYVHRIGRTARMGNIGMATSFYNDNDEGLANDLVKILMENGQTVPEFLEQYKPEDGNVNFDSDEEGSVDSYKDFHARSSDSESGDDSDASMAGSASDGSRAGSPPPAPFEPEEEPAGFVPAGGDDDW
ncbi:putative DEAD/DEAH box RNA helicase [Eremomyces bilateralis CBS 781.70]|uniref:RNA helicase n=1 Tax=Eremomyces bilateralis CBS 781.70 TaxID=1392243 RepID=A0A6G1FYT1_9PEZI|nr:putative DEAD/DEAH box RNA helicase [Eremomyces bilateralis CBS 781.70]KAF1810943.1 putative DEAD/DEAH box RNA helicase [Eremomyces bilateralis CBS 781.70]